MIHVVRPYDGFFGKKLKVVSDSEEIFSILPDIYKNKCVASKENSGITNSVREHNNDGETNTMLPIENISDIVMDIGRRPHCWIHNSRIFLFDDELRTVQLSEVNNLCSKLGNFGIDNRAGLNGQLHRFSAMRDRDDQITGITIRVGRFVTGNADMLMDLLLGSNKSILILGEPGR